jgi:hypothetical protein
MQSPWGGYPGYTSVQVEDFNPAGESAFRLRYAQVMQQGGGDPNVTDFSFVVDYDSRVPEALPPA